jgi:hypothetical protein
MSRLLGSVITMLKIDPFGVTLAVLPLFISGVSVSISPCLSVPLSGTSTVSQFQQVYDNSGRHQYAIY